MVNLFSPISLVLPFGWCNLYPLVYYVGGELSIIYFLYLSVFIFHLYYQPSFIIPGLVWVFHTNSDITWQRLLEQAKMKQMIK